ncbi:MAG: hypothetical protein M0R30_09550 [Methanoregula sp.]|uniref:hypothetical protein n=1 Tax=Methanoregula sp. TaxID=2052170 RepID=UPI0025CEE34D|nr:hypothetical protein [Methanoregula sp.]MCK9631876.1 hypothetical protein [Methanoregula sp.]
MPGSAQPPLARFVLFMIALSVAGSIVAGVHYAAVDLPAQERMKTAMTGYTRCTGGCISSNVMYITPTGPRNPTDDACMQKCREEYLHP